MKVDCHFCAKEFQVKESRIKNVKNPCCSMECMAKHKTLNKIKKLEEKLQCNLKIWLENKYNKEKLPIRKIAKEMGYSSTSTESISKLLSYYGIEIRKGSEAIKTQWLNNTERRNETSKLAKVNLCKKESRDKLRKTMQTLEYKRKISKANKGSNNGMYGKRRDEVASWQGGVTLIKKHLREATNEWKKACLEKHNFRCFVTGKKGKLHVHHASKSFREIRNEIFRKYNLELDKSTTIGEIDVELLNKITEDMIKYHNNIIGLPMLTDVHKLFHDTYGYKDNTYEQLLEFKNNFSELVYKAI